MYLRKILIYEIIFEIVCLRQYLAEPKINRYSQKRDRKLNFDRQ
jgi:hypothetical protein